MTVETPSCDICEILPQIEPEFVIIDGQYWNANLRDRDQALLGTTFISLKRHASELDDLTLDEDSEFIVIRNGLIRAIRASFSPVTFNLSCLKNDAFKKNPDGTPAEAAHVHWHLKPRYTSSPQVINNEVFTDPLPGKYLSVFERKTPSRETAVQIAQIIRSKLVSV